jgi:hypothetical protein
MPTENGTVPVGESSFRSAIAPGNRRTRRSPPLSPDHHGPAVCHAAALYSRLIFPNMHDTIARAGLSSYCGLFAPAPPHYSDVDQLISAVTIRIKGRSEHVTLTPALRKRLLRDKETHENAKAAKHRRTRFVRWNNPLEPMEKANG